MRENYQLQSPDGPGGAGNGEKAPEPGETGQGFHSSNPGGVASTPDEKAESYAEDAERLKQESE